MDNKNSASTGGITFSGLLFVALLVLKLVKVIDWSWWRITAPLWIPAVLVIIVLVVGFIIYLKTGGH